MKLRELKRKDAVAMLEWMHDLTVVAKMGKNFQDKKLEDCYAFIENAQTDQANVHRAIVNEKDEYLGTVSLKNINRNEKNAEFAIVVCKKAMGKGIAARAMNEILNFGKNILGLKMIFWCVRKDNIRANKFYKKNGFKEIDNRQMCYGGSYDNNPELNWFIWGV